MYDMTKFKIKRYEMKLKNGRIIHLAPPKLKTLKKIIKLSKAQQDDNMTEEGMDDLIQGMTLALKCNQENYKISQDMVEDMFDIDETQGFLADYFKWVNEILETKN